MLNATVERDVRRINSGAITCGAMAGMRYRLHARRSAWSLTMINQHHRSCFHNGNGPKREALHGNNHDLARHHDPTPKSRGTVCVTLKNS